MDSEFWEYSFELLLAVLHVCLVIMQYNRYSLHPCHLPV